VRNEPARTAGGQPLPVVGTQVVTLPNVLSFLRLVGVPVFLWLILAGHDGWALAVLMASGVSDYLDGKIARHYGMVSRIGQLLDPLADRLYILSTLVGLAYVDIIPWWLVAVLLAREVFGSILLLVVRRYGYVGLPVHFIGKAATFNLLYAFPLLLMAQVSDTLAVVAQPAGWAFVWWGTGLYWVAGALYAVQVRDLVRAAKAEAR
jgi:cardiolipin synthase (CMP-forming)